MCYWCPRGVQRVPQSARRSERCPLLSYYWRGRGPQGCSEGHREVDQRPARQVLDVDRAQSEPADEELRPMPPLIPSDEMAFYDAAAQRQGVDLEASDAARQLRALMAVGGEVGATFPEPRKLWIDSPYEPRAQLAAYRRLAPIAGRVALQLGGRGLHAVKFLLAGASEAWLCSPVDGELRFGEALAELAGVSSRFRTISGYGEAI